MPILRAAPDNPHGEMPFLEHLRELRARLMVCLAVLSAAFVVALLLHDHYVAFLIEPFGEKLYATRLEQAFMMKIRVSMYGAFVLSFPVHLYNVVAFVLPALTPRERAVMGWLLGGSFFLLALGVYMGYWQILPLSIAFLKSTALRPDGVELLLSYQESLSFVTQLMVAFLALFQLPLVLIVLMAMNVVRRRDLLNWARYIIILIFFVAAVLTPPDVVSQLGLAGPLIFLFYVTILVAKICGFGEGEKQ